MFGVDDAIIASAASAGIGALSNAFGQSSANQANRDIARETNEANMALNRENNAFSASQADRMMNFQERMSNTSWQRGMADMKAAGINPMLAFSKGGASTTTGAMASPSSVPAQTGAPAQNVMSQVIPAINSALQVYQAKAQLDNLRDTGVNIKADTALKASQASVAAATAKKTAADTQIAVANTPKAQVYGKIYEGIQRIGSSAKELYSHASGLQHSHTSDSGLHSSFERFDNWVKSLGKPQRYH